MGEGCLHGDGDRGSGNSGGSSSGSKSSSRSSPASTVRPSGEVIVLQAMTMLRDPIARAVSQFEHHISRNRYSFKATSTSVTSSVSSSEMANSDRNLALKAVVSPQLCPQLERRPTKKCNGLTNELKCRANGENDDDDDDRWIAQIQTFLRHICVVIF